MSISMFSWSWRTSHTQEHSYDICISPSHKRQRESWSLMTVHTPNIRYMLRFYTLPVTKRARRTNKGHICAHTNTRAMVTPTRTACRDRGTSAPHQKMHEHKRSISCAHFLVVQAPSAGTAARRGWPALAVQPCLLSVPPFLRRIDE